MHSQTSFAAELLVTSSTLHCILLLCNRPSPLYQVLVPLQVPRPTEPPPTLCTQYSLAGWSLCCFCHYRSRSPSQLDSGGAIILLEVSNCLPQWCTVRPPMLLNQQSHTEHWTAPLCSYTCCCLSAAHMSGLGTLPPEKPTTSITPHISR